MDTSLLYAQSVEAPRQTSLAVAQERDEDFRRLVSSPRQLRGALSGILDRLVDECALDLVFSEHRARRLGLDQDQAQGRAAKKTKYMCRCDTCLRQVNYAVFARHLEACMGLGRRSTRSKPAPVPQEATNNKKTKRRNYNKK